MQLRPDSSRHSASRSSSTVHFFPTTFNVTLERETKSGAKRPKTKYANE